MRPGTGRLVFSIVLIGCALVVFGAALALSVVQTRRRSHSAVERIDAAVLGAEYGEAADAAVAELERTVDPSRQTALRCRLARAMVGLEEYEAAGRVATEAAAAAPAGTDRADALVELARVHAALGRFDEATAALSSADELGYAGDGRTRRDLVAVDVALARLRFDDAERSLADAFATAPPGALADEAALGHARLQYLRGNFHQSVAELNRLIERAKGDDLQAATLLVLARALLDQERPAPVEADQAISSALVLARYRGLAALVTACSAVVQAQFDNVAEAEDAVRRAPALTISPRYSAEAHCLAGDALRRLDRYGEARALYQRALGLDSGSLEALWGLGTCAQMSGHYEVAESYFRLCLEAAPEHFLGRRSEDAIER